MKVVYHHESGVEITIADGFQTITFEGRKLGEFPAYEVICTAQAIAQISGYAAYGWGCLNVKPGPYTYGWTW